MIATIRAVVLPRYFVYHVILHVKISLQTSIVVRRICAFLVAVEEKHVTDLLAHVLGGRESDTVYSMLGRLGGRQAKYEEIGAELCVISSEFLWLNLEFFTIQNLPVLFRYGVKQSSLCWCSSFFSVFWHDAGFFTKMRMFMQYFVWRRLMATKALRGCKSFYSTALQK